MTEWWTYRPSDFLMFSARTYHRLFELYNTEVWPGHVLAVAAGLALLLVTMQRKPWGPAAASLVLAACWLWVAWAFHWQRYSSINTAAPWFAAGFAIEGLLLLIVAGGLWLARVRLHIAHGWDARLGLLLWLFALLVQPWLVLLQGRPLIEAQVFGIAPDPTVVATLGWLLMLRPAAATGARARTPAVVRLLWPVPLLWCLISGMTLWTMSSASGAGTIRQAAVSEL